MLQPLLNHDTAEVGHPLHEITRAIRRICLLQETDRDTEATRLESAHLIPLIAAFRDAHGIDSLPDDRIRDIRLSEQKRVVDAAALGELIAPLLAEYLGISAESGRARPSAARGIQTPALRHRPTSAPEIADLLDGMLAQENPRPLSPSRRNRT